METKRSVLLLIRTQLGTVRTTMRFLILGPIGTHQSQGTLVNPKAEAELPTEARADQNMCFPPADRS